MAFIPRTGGIARMHIFIEHHPSSLLQFQQENLNFWHTGYQNRACWARILTQIIDLTHPKCNLIPDESQKHWNDQYKTMSLCSCKHLWCGCRSGFNKMLKGQHGCALLKAPHAYRWQVSWQVHNRIFSQTQQQWFDILGAIMLEKLFKNGNLFSYALLNFF